MRQFPKAKFILIRQICFGIYRNVKDPRYLLNINNIGFLLKWQLCIFIWGYNEQLFQLANIRNRLARIFIIVISNTNGYLIFFYNIIYIRLQPKPNLNSFHSFCSRRFHKKKKWEIVWRMFLSCFDNSHSIYEAHMFNSSSSRRTFYNFIKQFTTAAWWK